MSNSLYLNRPISKSAMQDFPDPYADAASEYMPLNVHDALLWAEHIFFRQGMYSAALERIVSYFLTEIDIVTNDREEKTKYLDYLNDELEVPKFLKVATIDLLCYGMSFNSVMTNIHRSLRCKSSKCGFEAPYERFRRSEKIKATWRNFSFQGTCPQCGTKGFWEVEDREGPSDESVFLKRWSPHEIRIDQSYWSKKCRYFWKVPERVKREIRNGDWMALSDTDWAAVDCVKENRDLEFKKGVIFHQREEMPAGVDLGGWTLARSIYNFRELWHTQVLRRQNEAVALDYILPFRLFSPAARSGELAGTMDPIASLSSNNTLAQFQEMLKRRRVDPAAFNFSPFPVEYQAVGMEVDHMVPKDLLEYAQGNLLDAINCPVEFYKASLSVQAAPVAIRLFESMWRVLVSEMNRLLQHIVDVVAKKRQWEPVVAKLKKVTLADDINKHMAMLQLMATGQISRIQGLDAVNVDFFEDAQNKIDEAEFEAKLQQESQERFEQDELMSQLAPTGGGIQQALGGAAPGASPEQAAAGGNAAASALGGGGGAPGAMPAGGGGAMPAQPAMPVPSYSNIEDIDQVAQQEASQLMGMQAAQRRARLARIEQVDPTLHKLVTSYMEDIRSQAESEGRQQMLMSQFGTT
jgi:hypothetical protein